MKRKSYDDNQIEELLKNLPPIQDQQNKDDLYRQINNRMHAPKRPKPQWIVPAFASVFVLFILVMIVPSIFSSMSGQFSQSSNEESTSESAESSMEGNTESSGEETSEESGSDHSSDEGITGDQAEEELADREEQTESTSDPVPLAVERYTTTSEGVPRVYFDSQGQVLIPVTWITEDSDPSSFSPDLYGLTQVEVDYTFTALEDEVEVVFPTDFVSNGSAIDQAVARSIQWRAAAYDADSIRLRTKEGEPVNLGNFGEIEEISPIAEGRYIYHIFTSTTGERFLVPVAFNGSFEEAVENMKEDRPATKAPVPDHVSFSSIERMGNAVQINLTHNEWKDPQERITAVEAILMTAKQYGFEHVLFTGISPREDSIYNYQQQIEVPNSINPLQP
ncbi:hypothetical protein H0266_02870 [Halobacillus locisalis]|uniref:Sigma-X negative effector n=1 Tax=Halobacillus locisalis TaxID=220753 RepID=A0A838CPD8_9BACI|nr:hypothetical protein [Halobacillus locisalis]MBA2173834.1 hypothetical protein [Halobacillus locisalis]